MPDNPAEPGPERAAVLAGCSIVITRPAHQADALKAGVQALGAEPILFPTIEIVACRDAQTEAKLARLRHAGLVVFVSPNAVWHGVPLARTQALWPAATVAAVGPATAEALMDLGIEVSVYPPEQTGAEALLREPVMAGSCIRGLEVFVFKGRGGVSTLRDGLQDRGASVVELVVYERQAPNVDATEFVARGQRGDIDVIVITSADSLHNLFAMVGEPGRHWLRSTQLLVVSERIAEVARRLGVVPSPIVTAGAGNEHILTALKRWKDQT